MAIDLSGGLLGALARGGLGQLVQTKLANQANQKRADQFQMAGFVPTEQEQQPDQSALMGILHDLFVPRGQQQFEAGPLHPQMARQGEREQARFDKRVQDRMNRIDQKQDELDKFDRDRQLLQDRQTFDAKEAKKERDLEREIQNQKIQLETDIRVEHIKQLQTALDEQKRTFTASLRELQKSLTAKEREILKLEEVVEKLQKRSAAAMDNDELTALEATLDQKQKLLSNMSANNNKRALIKEIQDLIAQIDELKAQRRMAGVDDSEGPPRMSAKEKSRQNFLDAIPPHLIKGNK